MKNFNLSLPRTFGHVPKEVVADVFKISTGNVLPLVKCESEFPKPAK